MASKSWMSLALPSSLAAAKQASAFCLANWIARSRTTLKPDVISFDGIADIHMPVLTISCTCLLNISLRKLAELLRDLEGLVLGHDVLPDYIICNSGGFNEATRFGGVALFAMYYNFVRIP